MCGRGFAAEGSWLDCRVLSPMAFRITLPSVATAASKPSFAMEITRATLTYSRSDAVRLQVKSWRLPMPNHVHLIAVRESSDGLRRAIGEVHRRYTRMVNFREGWRGHLWQGRFASCVLDESHLLTAARYVELNPVRARLNLGTSYKTPNRSKASVAFIPARIASRTSFSSWTFSQARRMTAASTSCGITTMPSSSATTRSPERNRTPPISTGTSRSITR